MMYILDELSDNDKSSRAMLCCSCGYNILESLPHDMFEGNLGRSIRFLSCPENNLLEIPMSYRLVSPLGK